MIPALMPVSTIQYPYLAGALVLGSLAVLSAVLQRRRARELGMIAVLGLPFAVFSFEFIPQYWRPNLVLWLGCCSLEDLLFAAATGVIAWSFAAERLHVWLPRPGWLRRFLLIYALGVGTGYLLKYTLPHPNVMNSTMVGIALSAGVRLWQRRDLWPLMLRGGLLFSLFYAMFLKLTLLAWPSFISQWSLTVPFGYWLGMPAYELFWAVAFGAVWPLFIAYTWGYSLQPQAARAARRS